MGAFSPNFPGTLVPYGTVLAELAASLFIWWGWEERIGIHVLTKLPQKRKLLINCNFPIFIHAVWKNNCLSKFVLSSLTRLFISFVRCKCGSRELCDIPECGDGMRLQVVSPATGMPGFCCDTVQCINGEYINRLLTWHAKGCIRVSSWPCILLVHLSLQ